MCCAFRYGAAWVLTVYYSCSLPAMCAREANGSAEEGGREALNPACIYMELRESLKDVKGPDVQTLNGRLFYRRPYQWRVEMEVFAGAVNVSICDGNTCWSYMLVRNRTGSITRIDVNKLLAKVEKDRALRDLAMRRLFPSGIISSIGDPTSPAWKDELAFTGWPQNQRLERKGEEDLNGTAVIRYDVALGDFTTRFWFGKADRIFRKNVTLFTYANVEKVQTIEAIHVDLNSEIPDETFRFQPPGGADVTDKTNEWIKELTGETVDVGTSQADWRLYALAVLPLLLICVPIWLVVRLRIRKTAM